MKLDLAIIGVPAEYRHLNPYTLTEAQRLDAFPSRGQADSVSIWMDSKGDSAATAEHGWLQILENFVERCESIGVVPFVLSSDRKNHDEHVRGFLQWRRRRIRDYLDKLNLVSLPVFDSKREYRRFENSWWLTSALRLKRNANGLDIGRSLRQQHNWIKTYYTKYPGTVTWTKWIQFGVARVGWSAGAANCWLWYEIRCPELPGDSGYYREQNLEEFANHVDDLWLPLVHNIRWWSTSNPRVWNF